LSPHHTVFASIDARAAEEYGSKDSSHKGDTGTGGGHSVYGRRSAVSEEKHA